MCDARPNWVDLGDIAAVAAVVLREPDEHNQRTDHLAAQSASLVEIAAMLEAATGHRCCLRIYSTCHPAKAQYRDL